MNHGPRQEVPAARRGRRGRLAVRATAWGPGGLRSRPQASHLRKPAMRKPAFPPAGPVAPVPLTQEAERKACFDFRNTGVKAVPPACGGTPPVVKCACRAV
ncbi:hypothetical protein GCM10010231_51420 [Streptomyces sindenensis]|nr:hypothetical protein GCM10010231_51420 [Streptomyces sindenensis]